MSENTKTETPENGITNIQPLNVDSLAGSLAGEQPEVSEHTVAAEMEKQEQRKVQFSELRDSDGNPFNPEIHVTDSNGDPVTTKNNKLRKRPGRKGGDSATGGQSHVAAPGSSAQNSGQVEKMQARQSGVHAARMFASVSMMIGGEEFRPMKDEKQGVDEMQGLEEAFGDYFESKEWEDIPPGVALTMVCFSFLAPRFLMPKTKTRVSKMKDWFAAKYFAYKTRKKGGKVRQLREDEKEQEKEVE